MSEVVVDISDVLLEVLGQLVDKKCTTGELKSTEECGRTGGSCVESHPLGCCCVYETCAEGTPKPVAECETSHTSCISTLKGGHCCCVSRKFKIEPMTGVFTYDDLIKGVTVKISAEKEFDLSMQIKMTWLSSDGRTIDSTDLLDIPLTLGEQKGHKIRVPKEVDYTISLPANDANMLNANGIHTVLRIHHYRDRGTDFQWFVPIELRFSPTGATVREKYDVFEIVGGDNAYVIETANDAYGFYMSKGLAPIRPCGNKYKIVLTTNINEAGLTHFGGNCVDRIELNPNYLTTGSIAHEVAHIFVPVVGAVWHYEARAEALAVAYSKRTYFMEKYFSRSLYNKNPYSLSYGEDWYAYSAAFVWHLERKPWAQVIYGDINNLYIEFLLELGGGVTILGKRYEPYYEDLGVMDGWIDMDSFTAKYFRIGFVPKVETNGLYKIFKGDKYSYLSIVSTTTGKIRLKIST